MKKLREILNEITELQKAYPHVSQAPGLKKMAMELMSRSWQCIDFIQGENHNHQEHRPPRIPSGGRLAFSTTSLGTHV